MHAPANRKIHPDRNLIMPAGLKSVADIGVMKGRR